MLIHFVKQTADGPPKIQDEAAKDPTTHGAMLIPIILGSDKTIASMGTGHVEYYPLYMSIGNLHNDAQRAHRRGVCVIGFLAIPKCKKFST